MNSFRVLQFNMQFGQGWRDVNPDRAPVDIGASIEAIGKQDADIIMLQEVEHAKAGGVQTEPPPNYTRIRAALPGYDGAFAYPKADPRELPFGIGLAVLSRSELADPMRLDLPSPAIPFEFRGRAMTPTDRVLLGVTTVLAGRKVQLLNTHLLAFFMLGATSGDHPEQVERVGEMLAGSRGPTILTGDFNANDHASLVARYARHGFSSVQTSEPTWRRKPFILDHIFYNSSLRCMHRAVIPTLCSDHHMLVADFEFTL